MSSKPVRGMLMPPSLIVTFEHAATASMPRRYVPSTSISLLASGPVRTRPRLAANSSTVSLLEDVVDCYRSFLETRQNLPGEHLDAPDRLLMGEETRAANDVEMAEGASLALELHDLAVDGVGVAGEEDALGHGLLRGHLDERGGILGGGLGHLLLWLVQGRQQFLGIARLSDLRFAAVDLGRGLRWRGAGQEFRHLRCRLEARVEEPEDLAADPHSLLIGFADIDHGCVGEHVARGRRQARITSRLLVRIPGLLGALGTTQHERVDDAAPAALGRRARIASRRPQPGHRLLIGARPDVHMAMCEVLALPAERTLAMGQRLGNEIDALPHSILVLHGIAVVGGHLAATRLDQPDLEPAA